MTGIGIGIGMCFPAPYIASGWSPADLFDGTAGYFYDFTDLTTLWSDSVGGTLISGSDNDDIVAVSDKSGNSNHGSGYTDDPRYGVDGNGVGYYKHDTNTAENGSWDTGVQITGATARSVFTGVHTANATVQFISDAGSGVTARFLLYVSTSNVLTFNQGTLNYPIPSASVSAATHFLGYVHDGSSTISGTGYVDGDAYAASNGNMVNTAASNIILTEDQTAGAFRGPDRNYWSLQIARQMTADEISSLKSWSDDLGMAA